MRDRFGRWQGPSIPCSECDHDAVDHSDPAWSNNADELIVSSECTREGCECKRNRSEIMRRPNGCYDARILDDGRLATFYQTIFGGKVLIGPADDMTGGNEWYDWPDFAQALTAWESWSGYGEPYGWYRHQAGNKDIERGGADARVPRRTEAESGGGDEGDP